MGRVKKLQEIALLAVYTDIFRSTQTGSDEVLSGLKKKMDEYLVSTHRPLREKLWEEFYRQLQLPFGAECPDNVCNFMSCILDDDFQHLKIKVKSDTFRVKLIETITHNSPSLGSISFDNPLSKWQSLSWASQKLFAKSFLGLKKLTTLKIDCQAVGDFTSFSTHIGHSCPNLTSLHLGVFSQFSVEQILGLVLGEENSKMLPNFVLQEAKGQRPNLHRLQFSKDCITPICKSLKSLVLRFFMDEEVSWDTKISCTAFLVRHFSDLLNVNVNVQENGGHQITVCSSAIQFLHEMLLEGSEDTEEFEVTMRVGQQANCRSLKWIANCPPPKTLKLENLKYRSGSVDLRNKGMLNAVISMCPELQVVRFSEDSYGVTRPSPSPHEVTQILKNQFQKVKSLIFESSYISGYRRAVIASVGGQLVKMRYVYCQNIDWTELLSCCQLEELKIVSDDENDVTTSTSIDAETFLPRLKKFSLDRCLGHCSHLFESARPTLKVLDVLCTHFGVSGSSNKSWNDAPILWPNLEELKFRRPNESLTLEKLRHVIPRMDCLKYLGLPDGSLGSKEEDEEAVNCFENQLKLEFMPHSNQYVYGPYCDYKGSVHLVRFRY